MSVTYAYVPRSSDNVYEDMDIGAILAHGPVAALVSLHAAIKGAISADKEKNEHEVIRVLLTAADENFFDPTVDDPAPDNALAKLIRATAEVTWELVQDLDGVSVSTLTEIDFVYYHKGGFAYSMM